MIPLPLLFRGKVRDVYEVPGGGAAAGPGGRVGAAGSGRHGRAAASSGGARQPGSLLLLVASDRVSAFDVVMAEPVPDKGRVLTQITAWWLSTHLPGIPHHVVSVRTGEIADAVPALAGCEAQWAGRATLVRRTAPLPVECVVRGYLSGSAWKEYRESGTLAGEPLPPGLAESDALVPAIFSPATKATEGHDENITLGRMAEILGKGAGSVGVEGAVIPGARNDGAETPGADLAAELRRRSLDIYERGRAAAAQCGIILADTKFEFGMAPDGELLLIDEVLTPDSSRFWPRERYRRGRPQPSLDKQPLRDHLDGLADWDKRHPPPRLPERVIAATADRYREVFRRLTGTGLEQYEAPRFGGEARADRVRASGAKAGEAGASGVEAGGGLAAGVSGRGRGR